ncbi:hypothetical protein ACFWBN_38695 [Streptomyces sp. NPDC059989]|uniref:hypothetical protein n=1 Tax=Streptomyces sp. NPDC059989 TaxID=3347026 RepID=UPI0036A37E0E
MPAKPLAKPPATTLAKPSATTRRLLAVAAATLVVAAASPATLAYARPSATVSPNPVAPGGRVSLNIDGCGTNVARVTSSAFGDVRLTPGNPASTNLFGSATVLSNASAGAHRVTFECAPGGERIVLSLQVTPGAARGGTGGSIDSMSPGQIAIGGALVAAALGGGAWVIRRRAAA